MKFNTSLRQAAEIGVSACAIAVLLLAGCGGGAGSPNSENSNSLNANATSDNTLSNVTTLTVAPFKGQYLSGSVVVKDANGVLVPLVSGGAISASGVAEVSFSNGAAYPLLIEVTGDYINEVTGLAETSTLPLRGLVASASSVAAGSAVPVTFITEVAVAELQNRQGNFSLGNSLQTASAVSALQLAGLMLGVPHDAIPNFDPVSHKSAHPDTLRLAALAVVAHSRASGANLAEKLKSLANSLATLNPASAPADVITQADFDMGVSAMTIGAASMMQGGASQPPKTFIATINKGTLESCCQLVQGIGGGTVNGGLSFGSSVVAGSGVGGLVGTLSVNITNTGSLNLGGVGAVNAGISAGSLASFATNCGSLCNVTLPSAGTLMNTYTLSITGAGGTFTGASGVISNTANYAVVPTGMISNTGGISPSQITLVGAP